MAVIISKTFTTAETMLNARTVRTWLTAQLGKGGSWLQGAGGGGGGAGAAGGGGAGGGGEVNRVTGWGKRAVTAVAVYGGMQGSTGGAGPTCTWVCHSAWLPDPVKGRGWLNTRACSAAASSWPHQGVPHLLHQSHPHYAFHLSFCLSQAPRLWRSTWWLCPPT
jgi:hypothetical protein